MDTVSFFFQREGMGSLFLKVRGASDSVNQPGTNLPFSA